MFFCFVLGYFCLGLIYVVVWDNVYGFNYLFFKEIVLFEFFVDIVEMKVVVIDLFFVFIFDFYKCMVEDLVFSCLFDFVVRWDDFIYVFVVWFDIDFIVCYKIVCFFIGLYIKYIYWK